MLYLRLEKCTNADGVTNRYGIAIAFFQAVSMILYTMTVPLTPLGNVSHERP